MEIQHSTHHFHFVEDLKSNFSNIEPVNVKWTPFHEHAQQPTQSYDHPMGWDIYCVSDEDFIRPDDIIYDDDVDDDKFGTPYFDLNPFCSKIFHTGIAIQPPPQYGFLLWDRSGLATKNTIHRLAGVIDPSYRGEWMVNLINLSNKRCRIYECDKIVQAILTLRIPAKFHEVDHLENETKRGSRGFGSSG